MEELGERNFTIISRGIKTIGSYDPNKILFFFEEELYMDEYEEVEAFLQWCHNNNKAFGRGNYEERFAEFKASMVSFPEG